MKSRTIAFLAVLLLTGLSTACGRRVVGYGVLLWSPPDTPHDHGAVVPIFETSRIRQTVTIPGEDGNAVLELPSWRIASFSSRRNAEEFAESFAPVSSLFAISRRNALPVRERADRLSERVYRLREGEMMKVLEKGTELSDENGLQGYWIRVLTEEGVIGYCFDLHLSLYDDRTKQTISEPVDPGAEDIAWILSSDWRPLSFHEMIVEQRIDLSLFRPEYGLFFDRERAILRIALPQRTTEYGFTRLSQIRPRVFMAEGTSVRMTIRANNELYVEYSRNGQALTDSFVAMDEEIDAYISGEQERRAAFVARLLARGPRFVSSAYGSLTFNPDGTFQWDGFELLVPAVIPEGANGHGSIDHSVFVGRELRARYDGVLNLRFGTGAQARVASFLYTETETGYRLVAVPAGDIRDRVVRRETANPLIIVFSRP